MSQGFFLEKYSPWRPIFKKTPIKKACRSCVLKSKPLILNSFCVCCFQGIVAVDTKSEDLSKKRQRPKAKPHGVQKEPVKGRSPKMNGSSSLKIESSASALPSVDLNHNPENFDAEAFDQVDADGDFVEDFDVEDDLADDDVDVKIEIDDGEIASPPVELPLDFVIQRYKVG